MVNNNWYPWWMKVDKGKVLLTFCPILTKRLTTLEYGHCQYYQRSDWKKSYSYLSQPVKFCIACHLSSHPLKCKCIFSVFLGHWYKFDLSFWWGWFLRTPSWLCLSPPDKPMSMVIKISNDPHLCLLIVSIFNIYFQSLNVIEIIFKMSGRWTL